MPGALGWSPPKDTTHQSTYAFRAVQPLTAVSVNRSLRLPSFHRTWDQGSEGACVGFGTSMMLSIINEAQARAQAQLPYTHRYDPWWLWNRAKEVDPWSDTNPGDDNGTSVMAACDVLRDRGHVRVIRGVNQPVNLTEGISTNRWASSVDEIRTAISLGVPCSIGVNWYTNFDYPQVDSAGRYWIGKDSNNLGSIRGGHCVCIYGAWDRYQAVRIKNSWGESYPLVWMPYKTLQRLIDEQGEVALVTDR